MKVKFGICFLFYLLSVFCLNAQSQYHLLYDRGKSPIMGAEILTTGNFMFSQIENEYLKARFWEEDQIHLKAVGISYRLLKSVVIDRTWHDFLRVFQHEAFGHGARAREYGWRDNHYWVGFPKGGGATYYGKAPSNRRLSQEEGLMRTLGGMEATMVLANTIRDKWLQSGKVQLSETYFYATSFMSFSLDIHNTDEFARNDVTTYLRNINAYHGNIAIHSSPFSLAYLKKRAIINFANPLPYFAILSYLKHYVWDGNSKAIDLPMIRLGRFQYLPMYRMGVTPHGTELYLENFLKTDRSLNKLYVRLGDRFFGKHWGLGISRNWILDKSWIKLNASADLWQQPEMVLGGANLHSKKEGLGGAAKLGVFIKLFKGARTSNLYGLFGYKSEGYLEGEYLRKGLFVRAGAVIEFQAP